MLQNNSNVSATKAYNIFTRLNKQVIELVCFLFIVVFSQYRRCVAEL